ncbi:MULTISPECIES: hypothetical protein [unclassified Roseitalea]|nr:MULTISPECIES: hypothetical protein [unclassified Roseitalea]
MLAFFGGVPEQLVSDNLRAGITKACFFADAILDRLIHNAHRLPLDGPSLRKTNANSDATAES